MPDTVRVTDGAVAIETLSQGEGPAFVILPSYGRDGGGDFDRFADSLAAGGYRVLRPQPRGVLGSTGPMDGVTLGDLGGDVAAVIRELGVSPAIVLGHAFGNFVARALATDHPALVSHVVLAAASGHTVDPKVDDAPFVAGDPTLPQQQRLDALRLAFFTPEHDASIWLDGWYPDTLRMQHAAVTGTDLSRYEGAGSAPILEIIAEADPFHHRDEWGDMRSAYGDRVTTTVIAGASHALFPERPAAVAAAVLDALPVR